MKTFLRYIISIWIFAVAISMNAQEMKVVYSGFGYNCTGLEEIAKRFPFTQKLQNEKLKLSNNEDFNINKFLGDKIEKSYKGNLKISRDYASISDGTTISLAFVVDYESVQVSRLVLENKTSYIVDFFICAQAMFYDFTHKRIVASYPCIVAYKDRFNVLPTEQQKYEIIKKMYLDSSFEVNIFNQFIKVLNDAKPKRSYESTIGITKVEIGKDSINALPANLKNQELAKEFVASVFNAYFSDQMKMPVLPYSSTDGGNIYVLMREYYNDVTDHSYVEGDYSKYSFAVPPPTYKIDLTLEKLASVIAKEEKPQRIYLFGSAIQIRINDIEKKEIFRERFKDGFTEAIVIGDEANWPFGEKYIEALLKTYESSTQKLSEESGYKKIRSQLDKCK